MDPEKVMPLIVFWIVWAVAVLNIRGHFKNRTMTAYLRRGTEEDSISDSPSHYSTTPAEHPISYWALLAFYSFCAIFVPAATLYVLW